jgi:hypothetical protein
LPTAILNRTLRDAVERRQPVSVMGHRLKFFYATQVRQAPPTFLLFVNRDELLSDQLQKISGRPDAPRLRLRRLSHRAGAQSTAQNRRTDPQTQAVVPETARIDCPVTHQKSALSLVHHGE